MVLYYYGKLDEEAAFLRSDQFAELSTRSAAYANDPVMRERVRTLRKLVHPDKVRPHTHLPCPFQLILHGITADLARAISSCRLTETTFSASATCVYSQTALRQKTSANWTLRPSLEMALALFGQSGPLPRRQLSLPPLSSLSMQHFLLWSRLSLLSAQHSLRYPQSCLQSFFDWHIHMSAQASNCFHAQAVLDAYLTGSKKGQSLSVHHAQAVAS